MSEVLEAVRESAGRVFAAAAAAPDIAAGWALVAESGLTEMLLPGNPGWAGLAVIGELAGYHALALPVGEAAIAAAVLDAMGVAPGGRASIGRAVGPLAAARFSGAIRDVPWGRDSDAVVAESDGWLFAVRVARVAVNAGANLAGDARDSLVLSESLVLGAPVRVAVPLLHQLALLRAAQSGGALRRALELSIDHANTRQQFGRPLGKFQAVQQSLAVLAEKAAACGSAAAGAAAVLDAGGDGAFAVAAAKLRACRAADAGAAIAHQVHGAIGFTQDYALQRYTRRLAAWRGEAGNERFWGETLGRLVAASGAETIWESIVASGQAARSGADLLC